MDASKIEEGWFDTSRKFVESRAETSGFASRRPEEEIESAMDPAGSRCINTTRSAGKDRMPTSLSLFLSTPLFLDRVCRRASVFFFESVFDYENVHLTMISNFDNLLSDSNARNYS